MGPAFDRGGGSASPGFTSVPFDIRAGGAALNRAAELNRESRRYGPVDGVGDYRAVAAAVADVVATWDPALDSWERSLGSLAAAADSSARAIETTDANLAAGWRTLEAFMPTARPL